ncbi:DivIVA domain-containing protein [Brachybacterium sp. Z12]|uniref:DivIVA domain-containing protein n=1 Tax=Brachybacterium sp. Z12 TaxID=2759167 RepID=UPI00185F700C|nr:DivIVA domain-containing protein [Brachybacterium sp. Z12]QNN83143.1 DivIVA domain-containing protein [Brachybacterium sp. Z12]
MQIRFMPVRFGEGYDMQEVDDFIDRCERALLSGDGSATAETVQQHRFSPTRFREGYDMEDVDRFLDAVLLPLFTSPETFPYDPERDYTGADLSKEARVLAKQQRAAERRAAKGERASASAVHAAERRPGLLGRLFGAGR